MPRLIEYIRTPVDPDADLARRTIGTAALHYALGPIAYRRHFERMGFGKELERIEATGAAPSPEFVSAVGAPREPGQARAQFERLAAGLDLAIVRILVVRPGDYESARQVIQECQPEQR